MVCHNCKLRAKKHGKNRNGTQRWRCKPCERTFSDADERPEGPLGKHRLPMDKAVLVLDAVTVNGARTLGLEGYGLEPGCHADLVILQAADRIEALRLRPARLFVIRRGEVIAETPAARSRVRLGDRELEADFSV